MNLKTFLSLLPFLFLALLQTGCDKFQKTPEVEIISRQVLDDGSVRLIGAVVSGKAKNVYTAGFEVSTDSNFSDYTYTEFYASMDGDKFTTVIPTETFASNTRYYFRPYAEAKKSYDRIYGQSIFLDDIQPPYVGPPCTLTANYVNTGTIDMPQNYYQVTLDAGSWDDSYTLTATTYSGVQIVFRFPNKPKTGVYQTVDYNPPSQHEVLIVYYTANGFNSYTIDSGASVYVHETEPNKWDISVCDATWQLGNTTAPFSTRVICPL